MRRTLGLLLVAGIVAACGEPTGTMPGRFIARYAAGTVGETPLPVTLKLVGSQRTLEADTISFKSDGTALRTTVVRLQNVSPPRDFVIVTQSPYSYKVDGKVLTLTVICGPNENCVGAVTGEITETRVQLPSSVLGLDLGRLFMERID